MEIYFLTTNRGKFLTAEKRLGKYGINLRWLNRSAPEPQAESLPEIASFKASWAYEIVKKPVMAVDAGLVIPSLNGFPGPFTSYVLKTVGVEGILRLLKGKERYAYFDHALAYHDPSLKQPVTFSHKVEGEIAERPSGERAEWWWSDLFSVFRPKVGDKVLPQVVGELSLDEWERIRKAIPEKNSYEKFAEWLAERGLI